MGLGVRQTGIDWHFAFVSFSPFLSPDVFLDAFQDCFTLFYIVFGFFI